MMFLCIELEFGSNRIALLEDLFHTHSKVVFGLHEMQMFREFGTNKMRDFVLVAASDSCINLGLPIVRLNTESREYLYIESLAETLVEFVDRNGRKSLIAKSGILRMVSRIRNMEGR